MFPTHLRACLAASTIVLASCTTFTHPQDRPVIEEGLRTYFWDPAAVAVLSLTPERRVVLHNFKSQKFCAEQPTETGIQLASAAKLLGSVELTPEKRGEVAAAFARESNHAILNRRSQSLQLYLAASYSLCQMNMNGELKPGEYSELHKKLLEDVLIALREELPRLYGAALAASAPQDSASNARRGNPAAATVESLVPGSSARRAREPASAPSPATSK